MAFFFPFFLKPARYYIVATATDGHLNIFSCLLKHTKLSKDNVIVYSYN